MASRIAARPLRLTAALARPQLAAAAPRIAAAVSARSYSDKPAPADKAASILDALPGNSLVSKTGSVVLGTGLAAAAVSNELYVFNEESVLLAGFIVFFGFVAKIIREPYSNWANGQIEKIKGILNSARAEHTSAVTSRIDSVQQLKDVTSITKDLFALSKETAQAEATAFELRQRVQLAAELKSVLDSWVRYEAQVRESEQKQLAAHVVASVQKAIQDDKFQKDVLLNAVAEVEQLVKNKAL